MAGPFSLGGLLRLRKLQEGQAAAEVSLARARAAEVAARKRHSIRSLENSGRADGTPETMRSIAAARSSSASMLNELNSLENEWRMRSEDARERHAEAKGRAHGLEKLERKHAEAFRAEEQRAEQILLDEISARTLSAPTGAAAPSGEEH